MRHSQARPEGAAATNLGNVLLEMGLVTLDRLKEAVAHQMDGRGELALGAVLLALGLLSQSDLEVALKVQGALRRGDELGARLMVLEYQTRRMDRSLDRQHAVVDAALERTKDLA